MLGAEALGLGGKLQALENGVLVRELVNQGLFVRNLGLIACNQLLVRTDGAYQGSDHLAQLLCAEVFQGEWLYQHGHDFARTPQRLNWRMS